MIDAAEANRLSGEQHRRLYREQLDRELDKCERAVQAAIKRGHWSCDLPIESPHVSMSLIEALKQRGYTVRLARTKRYRSTIHWGAPLKEAERHG